jgi:hypothetical protein
VSLALKLALKHPHCPAKLVSQRESHPEKAVDKQTHLVRKLFLDPVPKVESGSDVEKQANHSRQKDDLSLALTAAF